MNISVSIVDYFKASRVCSVVDALSKQTWYKFCHVTIFDNSVDSKNSEILNGVRSRFDKVDLVVSKKNIGYVKGTNASVDLDSDYIVLLNPDVILADPGSIESCIKCLEDDPGIGLIGMRQVDDEGNEELVARRYPSIFAQVARRLPYARRVSGKHVSDYECKDINGSLSGVHEVDWVQSSFWVVRTCLWRDLSGLDERYFLFMSEPDFSRRANARGFRTAINRDVCAQSDGLRASGGGLLSLFMSRVFRAHVIDAAKYYLRWQGSS